jgi:virginiamycin B lyase
VTITEFPVGPGSAPRYIHPGPDGNLWFTDGGTNLGVDRISTTGEFITPIPDPNGPVDLVTLPDGTVVRTADRGIGRRLPSGDVVTRDAAIFFYAIALMPDGTARFSGESNVYGVCRITSIANLNFGCSDASPQTRLTGLALGSDGRMWAAASEANVVYRLDANGGFQDKQIDLPPGSTPARLVLAGDRNLWVTMHDASAVDRISPSGTRLTPRYPLPPGSGPNDITVGPDGALWIAEYDGNRIDRMTLDGTVTNKFDVPTPGAQPTGITTGPDGAIWFTELGAGKIGRLQLDPASGGGPGGVVDHIAPSFVRGAAFSHARFRVAAGRTPVSARRIPRGTTLSYSLSEPALVKIVIARKAAGRKVGKSCRAPSHSNRGKRHCTRYAKVGTLTRHGLQGPNAVKFTGHIGRRKLRPASYRATVTAKDAAGNASKASSARFTIVR